MIGQLDGILNCAVDWDVPRPHPLSTLIAARLELKNCNFKLKTQIKKSPSTRNCISESWKTLREKQTSLNTLHLEFENLGSEDKKNRAEEKLNEERNIQVKLRELIETFKEEVQKLAANQEKLQKYLKCYQKFEEYVRYFVQHNDEFSNVDEVLERYRTLRIMHTKHRDNLETDLQFMIESRNDIDDLTEEKCNKINFMCNRFAQIRAKAIASSENHMYCETVMKAIKTFIAEKKVEIEMVKSATWSLYLQMSRHQSKNAVIEKHNFEEQIKFIYKTLVEYKRIVQISQAKAAKSFQSDCPNSSADSFKHK